MDNDEIALKDEMELEDEMEMEMDANIHKMDKRDEMEFGLSWCVQHDG